MNSIKNLLVVILLMGVSYGAFQVINSPDPTLTAEVPDIEELDIDLGPLQSPISADMPMNSLPTESPNEFPVPPPGMSNSDELIEKAPPGSELELPDLDITQVPMNGDGMEQKTRSSNSAGGLQPTPSYGGSGSAYGQFQSKPQTDLQPMEPRPVSDIALSSPAGQANGLAAPAGGAQPPVGEIDWVGINNMVAAGNTKQALSTLSAYYQSPLPSNQRMQMLQWLDELAGKVIYSTEHQLESRPYVVVDGDTLDSLAAQWNVPRQLIYNINESKIGDPSMLVAGTELKVVRGPFHARISVADQEMTLFLGDMYAGRFAIDIGMDHEIAFGEFVIDGKTEAGKEYRDQTGQVLAAGVQNNPYGRYWIGFENSDLCIHESVATANSGDQRGCIRLSSRDAADIYGILSPGSRVSILR